MVHSSQNLSPIQKTGLVTIKDHKKLKKPEKGASGRDRFKAPRDHV